MVDQINKSKNAIFMIDRDSILSLTLKTKECIMKDLFNKIKPNQIFLKNKY